MSLDRRGQTWEFSSDLVLLVLSTRPPTKGNHILMHRCLVLDARHTASTGKVVTFYEADHTPWDRMREYRRVA